MNPDWLCLCGHSERLHTLTNYITTQDACAICMYSCMNFTAMDNLEYLEYKCENSIS